MGESCSIPPFWYGSTVLSAMAIGTVATQFDNPHPIKSALVRTGHESIIMQPMQGLSRLVFA